MSDILRLISYIPKHKVSRAAFYTYFLFLFPFSFLTAQNMAIEWQNCFGGTYYDYNYDIIEADNGYLILGHSFSDNYDAFCNHGEDDYLLIRIDSIGEMNWSECFGGSSSDGGTRIFSVDENNYYLIGGSLSSDGDINFDPYPGTLDYWILKVDNTGSIIWEKIVGGNNHDQLWTGTTTYDGGIAAFGWSNSTEGDISVAYGGYDMWLVKLDSEGEVVWDKSFGTVGFDYGKAIIETYDHGFLIGGNSKYQGGGNLNCDEHHGDSDAVLIKLDSLGNMEWQQCYGGSRSESFTRIAEFEEGYILTGYTNSDDGDVTGWHPGYDHLDNPLSDIWVARIDPEGNLLWQKCLGGSEAEGFANIRLTESGDIMIIGVTQSNDGDVSGNHTINPNNHDIWMIKLSSEGEFLWQQCIGGEGDEKVNFGVIQKSDHRYVIAGQSDWPSDDVDCDIHHEQGSWWPDFWVFEVYDTTVNINETPLNHQLNAYPNPAANYVIFETSVIARSGTTKQSPSLLTITNTLGQQITQLEIKDTKTVWDTRKIQNGVYFYFCEVEGKQYSGKLVVHK